ncbi:hypothetical protein PHYPSEUDO_011166 [Phytophthora pseudosyringae]|uniref:Ankyrin repeat-containing domain n=1 Tax=Phytophthora pseudosyringae TaxID=221518 RepID=A0A8T1VDU1_9STRA|nr:hypothetical protein PHYPSEUDO_011166 [Phytophthora pseudosyringae]
MVHPPNPVTSVTYVCNPNCRVAALPRAMDTMSEFLDYSIRWSLPDACGFDLQDGALRLAQRVTIHEAVEAEKAERIIAEEAQARAKAKSKPRAVVPHNMNAALTLRKRDDPFFRQRKFTLAMAKAAARGDLRVIKWLVQQFPGCYVTFAVEEAAKNGHLDVLKWLHRPSLDGSVRDPGGGEKEVQLDVFWGSRELFYAGQNGHLNVVEWLQEHTNPTPTHMFFVTLEEAAKNGDLAMVKWLCEVRGEQSSYASVLAASEGHLDVLKWLRGNIFNPTPSVSMDDAAASGHLAVLQWMQTNSGYATTAAMNKAAAMDLASANGHLEIVQCQEFGRDPLQLYAFDKFYTLRWLKQKAKTGGNTQGRR